MDVKEIVKKYLKDNGYDGLCEIEYGCACNLDDLIVCGEDCSACYPGYFHKSKKCKDCEEKCDAYDDGMIDCTAIHIKPEVVKESRDE